MITLARPGGYRQLNFGFDVLENEKTEPPSGGLETDAHGDSASSFPQSESCGFGGGEVNQSSMSKK